MNRPKRHRRLFDAGSDDDSDGSHGDHPSHTSISRPSSYHDVSVNPAQPSFQLLTSSTSNTSMHDPTSMPETLKLASKLQHPSIASTALSTLAKSL
jgi:hypothetical protein